MKRTFIFSDDKSNKFWTIEVNGNSFTVVYGKVGTAGQTQIKEFDNESACQKAADKLIAEKTKKGYTESDSLSTYTAKSNTEKNLTTDNNQKEDNAEKGQYPWSKGTREEKAIALFKQGINDGIVEFTKLLNEKVKDDSSYSIKQCTDVEITLNTEYIKNDYDGNQYLCFVMKFDGEADYKSNICFKLSYPCEILYPISENHGKWRDAWYTIVSPVVESHFYEVFKKHPDLFFPKVHLRFERYYVNKTKAVVIDEERYAAWLDTATERFKGNVRKMTDKLLSIAQDGFSLMFERYNATIELEEKDNPQRVELLKYRTWIDEIKLLWREYDGQNSIIYSPVFNNWHLNNSKLFKKENHLGYRITFENEIIPITSKQWEEEVVTALTAFVEKKRNENPDFYFPALKLTIEYSARPNAEVKDNDMFNHKSTVKIVDEKRYEAWHAEMIHLIRTGYEDLKDKRVYRIIEAEVGYILDLMPELGYEALDQCFNKMYRHCDNDWQFVDDGRIADPMINYYSELMESYGESMNMIHGHSEGFIPAPEEYHEVLCLTALHAMLHNSNSKIYTCPPKVLRYLAKSGSQRAKNIVKFGTGSIAKEYMEYKDKDVVLSANDIKQTIDINIKVENKLSYQRAVRFITELLKENFPVTYKIKLKTGAKNYVKDILGDSYNLFWSNSAQYPDLFSDIKEYVRIAIIKGRCMTYEENMSGEEMPIGGYALYALNYYAAGNENDDIIAEYMQQNDTEHTNAMDKLGERVVERVGVSPETFPLVADCLSGSSAAFNRDILNVYKDQLPALKNYMEGNDITPAVF